MLSQDEKNLLMYGHISIIEIVLRRCVYQTTDKHLLTILKAAQHSAIVIKELIDLENNKSS